ncbi:uncharacterized protein LOC108681086 isoform X2 [Hyalella azteca]|uniref:Uncharacterized protein LOC108681086 isoform X2 n=1 Tax=Hyalella azteca TaxID=294128 RepID=A0A8B7PJ96_HYAAZ|nr:uncharacterized protein LOC108681086 isoform X2 [Hyalella azteca]
MTGPQEARGVAEVPQQRQAGEDVVPANYDADLQSLKHRIEAASQTAASDSAISNKIARTRGQKIQGGQALEEPALTRAIFAKKKIKKSKWPIVYGALNAGLVIAIIALAIPYFKEGQTIVDEYERKKKEEDEEQTLYALYGTSTEYDGYGTYAAATPSYAQPVYGLETYEHEAYPESSKFGGKGKGKKGGGTRNGGQVLYALAPAAPAVPASPPVVDISAAPAVPAVSTVPVVSASPYSYGDDGELSSHTMVFHDVDEAAYSAYGAADGTEHHLNYVSLDGEAPLSAHANERPLNELNYYNPTVFTSPEPSSYSCLERMVCRDPSRTSRALHALSGEKLTEPSSWQTVVDRIDKAAKVGLDSGDCDIYYCPPQLPNSEIFERGENYSPPPADYNFGEVHDAKTPYPYDYGKIEESALNAEKYDTGIIPHDFGFQKSSSKDYSPPPAGYNFGELQDAKTPYPNDYGIGESGSKAKKYDAGIISHDFGFQKSASEDGNYEGIGQVFSVEYFPETDSSSRNNKVVVGQVSHAPYVVTAQPIHRGTPRMDFSASETSNTLARGDANIRKENPEVPEKNPGNMFQLGNVLASSGILGPRASIVQLIQAPKIRTAPYHKKVSVKSQTDKDPSPARAPVVFGSSSVVTANNNRNETNIRRAKSEVPNSPPENGQALIDEDKTSEIIKMESRPTEVPTTSEATTSDETTTMFFAAENA